ncbi:hypothetical protein KAX97_00795 [candidate division WOR-3 bacterium]|nr:hypothetical protein [candidate division WOR-3 bacterium]
MSLLCCFLCLQINIEVNALANIYYSYSGSNLFFINPGFANPSMSRGLLGFPLNPAGLSGSDNFEVMVCYGPSMKTKILTEFAVPFDTIAPIIDTVKIPTDLGIQQSGGVDFFGVLFKIKGWRLGIGVQEGDYIGLDFSAVTKPTADYEINYDYTFTHADIQGIPIGYSIPVHIEFEGKGDLILTADGQARFKTNTLAFAAARRFLSMDIGLGWKITPVLLRGSFYSLFNGALRTIGNVLVEPTGDWTINASFEAEIDADSVIDLQGDAEVDFYLSSLYWGLKKEWRYVSIGLCGEFSFPTFINGDWEFITSIPTEFPKIRIDDDNLVVDTLNKVISGHAKIVVYDFERDDKVAQDVIEDLFLGTGGITAGINFHLRRFETGLFAGINSSSDGSYLKMRAGLNVGYRTFIPLHAGVIFHFQYFDIDGIPVSALPVISFGAGTDFNIKKFNIFLNLSGNTTQGAASFIIPGIVGGEKKISVLMSLGIGLRFHF